MGQVAKDIDITAPLKSAEDRAKEIVEAGNVDAVKKVLEENDKLKEPRAAELRTTEAKE